MMALQTTPTIAWPDIWWTGAAYSVSSFALVDAPGEYIGLVIAAQEAMTISHVGLYVGAAVGSPVADVNIETVGATGLPSGSLWATNTGINSAVAVGWNLFALTAAASIAAGQVFCALARYSSGTSFTSYKMVRHLHAQDLPYYVFNGGKDNLQSDKNVPMAFGSNATTFYNVPVVYPYSSQENPTFNNSTGARRGVRFQVPFKCRCIGLAINTSNATGDYSVVIYNDAGTELSSSSTAYDGDHSSVVGAARHVYFDNPVTLSPATWYRAAVVADTATNVLLPALILPSADYRAAMPGGTNFFLTTYATAGGWVDTATDKVPGISLLIDQLDDGVSAGGAPGHANMTGGLQ